MKFWTRAKAVGGFVCIGSVFLSSAVYCAETETLDYLKSLSIEQLLQTEITSVSKKAQSLLSVAAAVTVITQEDIERSGARSIPEALRMVPGLFVGNIDSSRYAIGARGFSEMFETKLLVLIDGRSMYTPLYSGVHWNSLDTILPDIERIEVIKGPGATVWGANAVNGVINIITKNSEDTQGGLLTTSVGNYELPVISARYGAQIGQDSYYRVYAKGFNREEYDSIFTGDANDGSRSLRGGIRLDSNPGQDDTISLQAEVYSADSDGTVLWTGSLVPPHTRIIEGTEKSKGGHVLGVWEHAFSDTSELSVQFYYQRDERDREGIAEEIRDTVDVEIQHHWNGFTDHDVVWGIGYHWTQDEIEGSLFTNFTPDEREDQLFSAFIQDEINLLDELLWFTIGTKVEYNDYSGWEFQPSARLRLQPTDRQLVWAAVSRAVRTPSRSDHDITITDHVIDSGMGPLAVTSISGSESFDSEELIAYELGYRWQATKDLLFDVAGFYNMYDDLRTFDVGTPYMIMNPLPAMVLPAKFANSAEGEAYGVEVQMNWQPLDYLKFMTSYSYIHLDIRLQDGVNETAAASTASEENYPVHQGQLRCYWDITDTIALDSEVYYVSDLSDGDVDDYVRFDAQLSWQVTDELRFSLMGENLFGSGRQESIDQQSNLIASEIPTQYWLKVTYRF